MNILVVGAGHIGLVTAACLANKGNRIYVYDSDKSKLEKIKEGRVPFYEKNLEIKGITVVPDLAEGIGSSEVIFVCVGTPCREDGGMDLSQVNSACDEIAGLLGDSRKTIVIRSTVIPGTTMELAKRIEKISGKKYPGDFGMVSNPEFLRQGDAVEDFLHNNRMIIGSENEKDAETVKKIYEPFGRPVKVVSVKTAEMAKYVNNCFSATKISFINEMGIISKEFGVDINEITDALDLRIGQNDFPLKAGCGFGGGCLEKDLKAFIDASRKQGNEPAVLESALRVNEFMIKLIVDRLEKKTGSLDNRRIGILGLSFKKGTDGTNNSRSIPLISELKKKNAKITAYDPKSRIPDVDFSESAQKLVEESDAVVIVSDWDEFSGLDYGEKIVIDGRNVVPKKKRGSNYEGICWP